ncbi:unnamed protein product [Angiostrongylus costaricensis]|uniref:Mannosyl-oligosaccharide glucosidase n=1 Tax=Angiostrongylus costaricensis TaxID=334426 RepID=A0A0R3PU06_ANGCS|nr:unnamed protein product [Angiostrongylus costaricensis]
MLVPFLRLASAAVLRSWSSLRVSDFLSRRLVELCHTKWGSYRPHTYFGLRTRDPRSPLFGVMWYEQPDVVQMPHIRHWCDQADGLKHYAWYSADGRTFGRQNITEKAGNLSVDWINHGETWTARLYVAPKTRYVLILYLVAQDSQSKFRLGHHLKNIISGQTELFGPVRLAVDLRSGNKVLHSSLVWNEELHLDHLNDLLLMNTVSYILYQQKPSNEGRFAAVQLNIHTETEIEIAFSRAEAKTGPKFQKELVKRELDFDSRFERIFHLEGKNYSPVELQMAKVALSNMLGGIGYWYGYNRVQKGGASVTTPYGPHELFSAVPSRSYFPRGFLWDEGFHNMLIRKFDPKLSLEILVSWLNTMSEDGWIPREMILGVEAEAKVPTEFIVQRTNVANPPSIFYIVDQMLADKNVRKSLALDEIVVNKPVLFRWRGRNATTLQELNPKTLASGLDDYPRASHPSHEEYHLDLRCWLAFSSRVMDRLAHLYEEEKHRSKYASDASLLGNYDDLVRLHWSEDKKAFYDYGRHSNNVRLVKKSRRESPEQFYYERSTMKEPRLGFVDDVFGYNSLFPLMLKLLPPESEKLGHILEKLLDPELLWTPFGIRSISRNSPYYAARNTEHDPPYWRGYIWININCMVLSALKHYGSLPGPNQATSRSAFFDLKKNLVNNMAKEFNRTGYIWENYDDRSGHGRGSHPFNGWSSLILMVMSDDMQA